MYSKELDAMLKIGLKPNEADRTGNPYRAFSLRSKVVMYANFATALRRIATAHDKYRASKKSGGVLIVAQPGSGKSTLLSYYASKFPRYEADDRTVVPVLYVEAPEQPTVAALAGAILQALGDPLWQSGNGDDKKARAIKMLKACKVEILMFDEFQHFYHGRRVSEAAKIPDWIKTLFNKVKIPIVVIGLPVSILVVRDAANSQLRRRFGGHYYMAPFSLAKEDVLTMRRVLRELKKFLPLPCPLLDDPQFAVRIFYASNGSFDYITRTIDRAVEHAGEIAAKSLTTECFQIGFREEVWSDCPNYLNPFAADARLRPLTQPGEPFEGWTHPSDFDGTLKKPAAAKAATGKSA